MEIVGDSLEEVWLKAAWSLLYDGQHVDPRGLKTREIRGVQLVITDPRSRIPRLPVREFSLAYAMGELAWYLCGDDSLEFIKHYAPSYGKYSDDGKRLHGAYGPRIFSPRCGDCGLPTTPQRCSCGDGGVGAQDRISIWDQVKQTLTRDPDSRQAVIPIFQPGDPGSKTKDMPCTLSLQFLMRDGKLDMVVNMRSNDLWFGGVYDIFCFTALQELMANEMDAYVGTYYHHAGSLHLYEKNAADVEATLNQASYEKGTKFKAPPAVIMPEDTIRGLLTFEKQIRQCAPVTALEELCASLQDFPNNPPLWTLACAAWRWKRVTTSAEIKEESRRYARGLLIARLGDTFERCFF